MFVEQPLASPMSTHNALVFLRKSVFGRWIIKYPCRSHFIDTTDLAKIGVFGKNDEAGEMEADGGGRGEQAEQDGGGEVEEVKMDCKLG